MQYGITLIPSIGVLLEKHIVPQLVKKFPAFYGTRRPITALTRAPPLIPILSQMNPVHAKPSIHFNILLPYDIIEGHFLSDATQLSILKQFSMTAGRTVIAAIPVCSE
jgi:hypothetical protein